MHSMKLNILTRLSLMRIGYKTEDITSSTKGEKDDSGDNVIRIGNNSKTNNIL